MMTDSSETLLSNSSSCLFAIFGCSPLDQEISSEVANSTLCLYRKAGGIRQEIKCNSVGSIRSKDENAFTSTRVLIFWNIVRDLCT